MTDHPTEPPKPRHWSVIAAVLAAGFSCAATAVAAWSTHEARQLIDVVILATLAFFVFKRSKIAIVVLILYSLANMVLVIQSGGKPTAFHLIFFWFYFFAAWKLFGGKISKRDTN